LRQIRVLLARMPKMLLDILSHVVASEPDMVVVGWVNDDEDLLAATRRARANVILVRQAAENEQEKYASLLFARPKLKVVAIVGDGKTGFVHELRPQCVPLGEISADALRNAIRGRPQSTTNAVL
jgi:DNA-binding NarL/FixJ family response regulator